MKLGHCAVCGCITAGAIRCFRCASPVVVRVDSPTSWLEDKADDRRHVTHVAGPIKLFLDDIREAPDGSWLIVRNIEHAKQIIQSGFVTECSLDHDLGACLACVAAEEQAAKDEGRALWNGLMPHCTHVGTGYDLCLWMAEHQRWPSEKPRVHSFNPCGRANMQGVIDRYYRSPHHEGTEAQR